MRRDHLSHLGDRLRRDSLTGRTQHERLEGLAPNLSAPRVAVDELPTVKVVFGVFGLVFIGLALAGESQSGNAMQRWISAQLNHHVVAHAGQIPNCLMWPTLALFAAILVFLVVNPSRPQKEQHS